jgi:hypothetical protein
MRPFTDDGETDFGTKEIDHGHSDQNHQDYKRHLLQF